MSDNKKRVLVPVTNPLGGIRTYMMYNLKPICEQGFHFTFLSKEGPTFEAFQQDVADWPGVDFIRVPKDGSCWKTVHAALKTKRFSLIHSQGLRAGTEAALANFFAKIPHLITLHDVIVPQNDIPGKFKWLKKKISGFFTRRATCIIPVSHDCAENHLKHFPCWKNGPCKIETISNGINVKGLLESRDAFRHSGYQNLRQEHSLPDDVVLGGFFGRFMPQKGFKYLLEALSELARRGYQDRFRLFATKDHYGYRNETIRSVAERPEVAPMVRFIEPVADIAPILSQMDVLVMPSLWEACPILPMEAMVLGIPVIGSDAIGLREVLNETPSVATPKENAVALADAIESFIHSSFFEQAKSFEESARLKFDVKIAVEKLLKMYREYHKCIDSATTDKH